MVEVGQGRGIRDLSSLGDEILVLAGPDDDSKNSGLSWMVSVWDGRSDVVVAAPRTIATLDLSGVALRNCDKELKPEAIAILARDVGSLDVVVMCDGGPLKFNLIQVKHLRN